MCVHMRGNICKFMYSKGCRSTLRGWVMGVVCWEESYQTLGGYQGSGCRDEYQ